MKYPTIIIFCLFYCFNALAQSIAPDGNFDMNIGEWGCGSANPTWISDDGSGLSGNGSLQMSRENFISAGGQLGIGHCNWIDVISENEYKFDGFYKLPTDSEFENMVIYFYWYTEDETFISVDPKVIPTNSINRDTWISFDYSSTAPIDATKLSISFYFQFYSGGQEQVSAYLLWDDLYLIEFVDEIFSDGFE